MENPHFLELEFWKHPGKSNLGFGELEAFGGTSEVQPGALRKQIGELQGQRDFIAIYFFMNL